MESAAFTLRRDLISAEAALPGGLLRFDSDKPYETRDPGEIEFLDQWRAVERVETGGGS